MILHTTYYVLYVQLYICILTNFVKHLHAIYVCVSSFKKIDKSDLLTAKDRFTHGHSLLNIDEIESLTVTLF